MPYQKRVFDDDFPPAVRPLVEEIERILEQRINGLETKLVDALMARDKAQAKTIRQNMHRYSVFNINEDLGNDLFRNLRRKRRVTIPRRAFIEAMAERLDCSPVERERLLRAAEYAEAIVDAPARPATPQPLSRLVVDALPMPALLLDRTWQIHTANLLFWHLWHLSPELWRTQPWPDRNMLGWIFATPPEPSLRDRLSPTDAAWEYFAHINMLAFKRMNNGEEVPPRRRSTLGDEPRFCPDLARGAQRRTAGDAAATCQSARPVAEEAPAIGN